VAQGVAVDSSGNAYVTGFTDQTNFPLVNSVQSSCPSHQCIFVAKVNAAGSAFIFSTYLGGGQTDQGAAIAADSKGNAYVTGFTSSTSFPLVNAVQSTMRSLPRSLRPDRRSSIRHIWEDRVPMRASG
jgi:hypothetical protein